MDIRKTQSPVFALPMPLSTRKDARHPDILCPSRLQAQTAPGINMQERSDSVIVCSGVARCLQAAAPAALPKALKKALLSLK
jgi:hypothetical protein